MFDAIRLTEWLRNIAIRRMVNAIVRWHIPDFKWIDAFQAADVVAVLTWIRAALMVRVDAAD